MEATEAAKLEVEKKMKRGKSTASSSEKPIDEVVVESGSEDEEDAPRSPSPDTKQKKEKTMRVTEADLRRYKDTLIAKSGVQHRVPMRPPARPLNPRLRRTSK